MHRAFGLSAKLVPVVEQNDFSLVRLREGAYSVRSRAYAETMHPGVGPQAEAEALYVRQARLVERLRRHSGPFIIWDIGLGAAANALTVIGAAQGFPVPLHLLSFDNSDAPLRFALQHTKELPYLRGNEAVCAHLLNPGNRRIAFDRGSQTVEWSFHLGDFSALIHEPSAEHWPKPHQILFDPFSPAKNPSMWTLPLFERLFRLLDPMVPCLMPTYSRSTLLRVTLLLAGFFVGTGDATGMKEETTVASNTRELVHRPLDQRWLERALRSDSAEPLRTAEYRRAPLSPSTAERLRQHPQFR